MQYCYDARDYPVLNSSVALLSKKHGQLKGAIQALVELVVGWLEDVKKRDGTEKWLELVETLRSITEGKVRVSRASMRDPHLSMLSDLLGNAPRACYVVTSALP